MVSILGLPPIRYLNENLNVFEARLTFKYNRTVLCSPIMSCHPLIRDFGGAPPALVAAGPLAIPFSQPFLNHLIFFLSFIQPQNIALLAKHFMMLLSRLLSLRVRLCFVVRH